MSDIESSSPLEELKTRQAKQKKDLQAKITGLKHSIPKNDKKKKKEVQAEVESLEKELKDRHQKEIDELESSLKATKMDENPFNSSTKLEEEEKESQKAKKLTKTQKQREKKAEKERKQALAVELDEESTATSRGTIETEKIEEILKHRKLRIVEIPSDGDCMFNAIAHQMNLNTSGTEFNGDNVRRKVSDYMRKNRDEFMPFLDEVESEKDFQEYCTRVEKSCRSGGDWGSATELKAASMALKRPIEVVHSDGPAHAFGENFNSKALVITFHQHLLKLGEHYNSTVSTGNEQ